MDGYLRSSDPHIYAVGEVASYEGGMVYGLWKPGTEQAEVRRPSKKPQGIIGKMVGRPLGWGKSWRKPKES